MQRDPIAERTRSRVECVGYDEGDVIKRVMMSLSRLSIDVRKKRRRRRK